MITKARNNTDDVLQPGDAGYKKSWLEERLIESEMRLAMCNAAKNIAEIQTTAKIEIAFGQAVGYVIERSKELLISQIERDRIELKKIEQAGAEGKIDSTTVDVARLATEASAQMLYQVFLTTPKRFDSHHR